MTDTTTRVRCPACAGIGYRLSHGNYGTSNLCDLCFGSSTLDPDEWHTADPARMVAMLGGVDGNEPKLREVGKACNRLFVERTGGTSYDRPTDGWRSWIDLTAADERPDRTVFVCEIVGIIRCLFPNPLIEREHIDPRWLSSDVMGLVREIAQEWPYGSGHYRYTVKGSNGPNFWRMPILADALMDAGCDDAELLAHCRGPGPHVSGCWVVEAISAAAADPPARSSVLTNTNH